PLPRRAGQRGETLLFPVPVTAVAQNDLDAAVITFCPRDGGRIHLHVEAEALQLAGVEIGHVQREDGFLPPAVGRIKWSRQAERARAGGTACRIERGIVSNGAAGARPVLPIPRGGGRE